MPAPMPGLTEVRSHSPAAGDLDRRWRGSSSRWRTLLAKETPPTSVSSEDSLLSEGSLLSGGRWSSSRWREALAVDEARTDSRAGGCLAGLLPWLPRLLDSGARRATARGHCAGRPPESAAQPMEPSTEKAVQPIDDDARSEDSTQPGSEPPHSERLEPDWFTLPEQPWQSVVSPEKHDGPLPCGMLAVAGASGGLCGWTGLLDHGDDGVAVYCFS